MTNGYTTFTGTQHQSVISWLGWTKISGDYEQFQLSGSGPHHMWQDFIAVPEGVTITVYYSTRTRWTGGIAHITFTYITTLLISNRPYNYTCSFALQLHVVYTLATLHISTELWINKVLWLLSSTVSGD